MTCALLLGVVSGASADVTEADYRRADSVLNRTRDKVFRADVKLFAAGKTHAWYRNDLANGEREYIVVDLARGQRRPAFDTFKLAATLGKATG